MVEERSPAAKRKKGHRNTGLYYYRARYYDSEIGRFLGEDPVRTASSAYSYVDNGPTDWIDPTGLIHQAWKERPFDGRLHDDPGEGLEVLCTKGRNRASDMRMLEHSIFVRSLEIGALMQAGEQPDAGHRLRLTLELATWKRCKDDCDKDKKPDPDTDPFQIPEEWRRWLDNRWEELKYTIKHGPQPLPAPPYPVPPPLPYPVPIIP
jgi:RHS repeat-associated protein